MKEIRVDHAFYGCETGCCGLQATGEQDGITIWEHFEFTNADIEEDKPVVEKIFREYMDRWPERERLEWQNVPIVWEEGSVGPCRW